MSAEGVARESEVGVAGTLEVREAREAWTEYAPRSKRSTLTKDWSVSVMLAIPRRDIVPSRLPCTGSNRNDRCDRVTRNA